MRRIFKALSISSIGIALDWITTATGLGTGLAYETNPLASPLNAIVIFSSANLLLNKVLPKKKLWNRALYLFNGLSFLGFINNIIILFQIFTVLISL